MQNGKIQISIIIPVFNEAQIIEKVISELKNEINRLDLVYEIIAVNDGSFDQSADILKKISGIKLIHHRANKGYGASLKTGAREALYDWLLFFDGDGQHKPEYICEFIKHVDNHDLIIGERNGYKGPIARQPGKKLLHWVANYLAETKIPDLNSGLRLVKRNHFMQYQHLFPNNFSLSTTSTLAFFREGLNIKYLPITINKRHGKSSLKITDGFETLLLITRLIMLFSPLKIFLPIALAGFAGSAVLAIYDLITTNFSSVSKTSGFIFVASLLVFLFGLLADQIAAIRRELKR